MPPIIASPSRRVVKAKAPPPVLLSTPPPPVIEVLKSPEDDSLEESSGIVTLASPSVEREREQERSEKWRKERLDATVAKQKQQRGKDLLGRRQSGTVQMTAIEVNKNGMMEPAEVPPAFSVEPQYPEHKRRSGDDDDVSGPLGKRQKSSIDDNNEPEEDRAGIRRATNIMFVTAALAAAVAIGVAVHRRFGRG